jgi:hypothetical protein
MREKESDHLKITSELENRYEHKLADQYDRYDQLSEAMELLKQACEVRAYACLYVCMSVCVHVCLSLYVCMSVCDSRAPLS